MVDIINLALHRQRRGLEIPQVREELGEIFVTSGDHEHPFRAHEIPDAVKFFLKEADTWPDLSIRFGNLTLLVRGNDVVAHGAYEAKAPPRKFLPPETRHVSSSRTDLLNALRRWAHDSELHCLSLEAGHLMLWKVPMDSKRFRFGYCWV